MIDALFARAGFSPNENQRHAIDHRDRPLLFVAGPGSGKTRRLLWCVVNVIVFHGIALFLRTFTEKAAKQVQDGLVSVLGLPRSGRRDRDLAASRTASSPVCNHPDEPTNRCAPRAPTSAATATARSKTGAIPPRPLARIDVENVGVSA